MKETLSKIKWIAGRIYPSLPSLILIVMLGALTSLCGIFRALILKKLIDSAVNSRDGLIAKFAVVFALILFADIILQAALTLIKANKHLQISNSIQKRLFIRLTEAKWQNLVKYHSGDILTRLTNDAEALTNTIVNTIPNVISLGVMLIGSFVTLLFFNKFLALVALGLAPATVLLSRIFARKLRNLYKSSQQAEAKYRSFLNESIQNMAVLKAFCLEGTCTSQVENLQSKKAKLVLSRNRINVFSNSVFSFGSWLGFFIVFCWGASNLSKGTVTYGTFTALLQLFGNIQGPFAALAAAFPQIVYAFASAERLMELEMLEPDIGIVLSEAESPEANAGRIDSAEFKPIEVDSDKAVLKLEKQDPVGIQFKNVSFGYKNDEPVLKNISVEINPGEILALIGASGEGKTTFIRLLLALVYPQNGHLYLTWGKKRFEINASSRKLISYVPQGNTLFSGSIADNLRYGNPDADDKELEEAARAACAWDFISSLENGLYTIIGEHGLGLSEGQAQRIAIARALLRKTPILVLDEATSALDSDTEMKVLETIRNLKPARTCIIITHRPSAVQICHRVLKIEGNIITEQYDNKSLLAQ